MVNLLAISTQELVTVSRILFLKFSLKILALIFVRWRIFHFLNTQEKTVVHQIKLA